MYQSTDHSPTKAMAKQYDRFNLTGDVMLGRLIDQLLPSHVDEPEAAAMGNYAIHTPCVRPRFY